MLPKKHRLMLRYFPDFFIRSKKIHSPLFTIFYLVDDVAVSQGAVIVPKKHLPLSTGRNKIKRQVAELLSSLFKTNTHLSVAVLVKKPLGKTELAELAQALAKL